MKPKFFNITYILFFLFTSTTIFPTLPLQADTEPLSLEQCISIALEQNPGIQSYRHQYRASKARVSQAKAFPQPEISLDYDLQPKAFQFNRSQESYIGVSQLIEFPGRRYLRGKIAKKESAQFQCRMELAKRDLILAVKTAFYQLLLELENEKYVNENLTHAEDFLDKAREKYQSGDVSKLEVLRARVEAARARNQKKIAANNIKLVKSKLNFLLAREKYQPITIAGKLNRSAPPLELKELINRALKLRPEIKQARLATEQGKLSKTQARLDYMPDLSLGVAKHRVSNEPSTWQVSLSFQVPLLFWQRARGEIAEADANYRAQLHETRLTELSISMEVENAYINALAFRDQIAFFEKEVLKEAQEVYRMSAASYKEGKIGSIELIEARKTLLELKQSYGETVLNYQLALAELEKFVGAAIH